jgi:Zn-finger nucleic acid-binding protein
MKCPRCIENLQSDRLDDVRVHRCTRCEGLWMPVDYLEQLCRLAFESTAADAADDEGIFMGPAVEAFLCPSCGKPTLQEALIGELEFVLCDPCDGAWLAHRGDLTGEDGRKDGLHGLLRKLGVPSLVGGSL